VYEQPKDECREQQQNKGGKIENAALLFWLLNLLRQSHSW